MSYTLSRQRLHSTRAWSDDLSQDEFETSARMKWFDPTWISNISAHVKWCHDMNFKHQRACQVMIRHDMEFQNISAHSRDDSSRQISKHQRARQVMIRHDMDLETSARMIDDFYAFGYHERKRAIAKHGYSLHAKLLRIISVISTSVYIYTSMDNKWCLYF